MTSLLILTNLRRKYRTWRNLASWQFLKREAHISLSNHEKDSQPRWDAGSFYKGRSEDDRPYQIWWSTFLSWLLLPQHKPPYTTHFCWPWVLWGFVDVQLSTVSHRGMATAVRDSTAGKAVIQSVLISGNFLSPSCCIPLSPPIFVHIPCHCTNFAEHLSSAGFQQVRKTGGNSLVSVREHNRSDSVRLMHFVLQRWKAQGKTQQ